MFKYIKYLIALIFLKKGFLFMILISCIGLFIIQFLGIQELNGKYRISFLLEIRNIYLILPFMFSTLVSTLLVVYIFKSGEEDGSDLLVVSKPLSRNRIVISKFLTLLLITIIYQFIVFITYYLTSLSDRYATKIEIFKFALTIAIGGITIQSIVVPMIVIFSAFITKNGTITLGMMSASLVPIVSMIIVPIAGGNSLKNKIYARQRLIPNHVDIKKAINQIDLSQLKINDLNGEKITYKGEEHTKNSYKKIDFNWKKYYTINTQLALYDIYETNDFKKFNREKNEFYEGRWYGEFSYFDFWYQWSNFYSTLLKTRTNSKYSNQYTTIKKQQININDDSAFTQIIKSNGEIVNVGAMIYLRPQKFHLNKLLKEIIDIFKENFPGSPIKPKNYSPYLDKTYNPNIDDYKNKKTILDSFMDAKVPLEERLRLIVTPNNNVRYDSWAINPYAIIKYKLIEKILSSKKILSNLNKQFHFLTSHYKYVPPEKMLGSSDINFYNKYKNDRRVKSYLTKWLVSDKQELNVIVKKPWLPIKGIAIFWGIISFLMINFMIIIYWNKDLK